MTPRKWTVPETNLDRMERFDRTATTERRLALAINFAATYADREETMTELVTLVGKKTALELVYGD